MKKERQKDLPQSRKRKSGFGRVLLNVFLSLLLVFAFVGLEVGGALVYYISNYIDPMVDIGLQDFSLDMTSFVYYLDKETGQPMEMERLYSTGNRIWVTYDEIPQYMIKSIVAIEDERFFEHKGVDWRRTLGAVANFVIPSRSSFGGSTITQQLIKNITGDNEVRIQRKIQEILRALNLEKEYDKSKILEIYLNTIYLSQGCNGVQSAANVYFGKNVWELSLAECACLAGITNLPTYYDPFQNPENNKRRQMTILNKLLDLEWISQDEYNAAVAEELVFNRGGSSQKTSMQSYYTDQVIEDVIDALQEEYDYTYKMAERLIFSGGLKIISAMDPEVQQAIDTVYQDPSNFPQLEAAVVPESSIVVVDPYSGAVLGMAGGIGEKTANRTLNRATQSYRQPGSSLKPLSVYAPAIEEGICNFGSVYDDVPVTFNQRADESWHLWPSNYNSRYVGLSTVKYGLQDSVNTVAVRILQELTPKKSFEYLTEKFGFSKLIASEEKGGTTYSDIGLPQLALGGVTHGVTALEMASAYNVFVNRGIYVEPYTFTVVYDRFGNILLENKVESKRIFSESTAYVMNELLQNVCTTGTGRFAQISNPIAMGGKTGTTESNKDRWFVGFTPYYTAAVWYGYDIPKTLPETSISPATLAFKAVMELLHKGLDRIDFDRPGGIVTKQYCKDSGMLAGPYCDLDPRGNRIETGYYPYDRVPTETCNVHIPVQICTHSNHVASPYCPESSRKTVALLNIRREFVTNFAVTDAQYVYWPLPDNYQYPTEEDVPVYWNLLQEGYAAGYSIMSSGKTAINSVCLTHLLPGLEAEQATPILPFPPSTAEEAPLPPPTRNLWETELQQTVPTQ
ncbi:MAG: PBP1A family penicillin-binding protein [Clostridia bacterium]|nr:PBP1A family penicillin-binding protein [Clostridia bacterium]